MLIIKENSLKPGHLVQVFSIICREKVERFQFNSKEPNNGARAARTGGSRPGSTCR